MAEDGDEKLAKELQEEEDRKLAESLVAEPAKDDAEDVEAPPAPELTAAEKEAKYALAVETKEAANAFFKAGDNENAVAKWEEALVVIAPVGNWTDSAVDVLDVRALRVSLHINSAAAHNKLTNWEAALASVEKATTIDATNMKAIFRRGVARAGLGLLDEAKEDFTQVAKADPKNRAAREELGKVKERIKERKAEEKERMQGLFSKSMYEDKEREAKAKAKAEAEKKKREAEAKAAEEAKLKEEWELTKAAQASTGEEVISWEDFEKKAKEDKKKAEEEVKKLEEDRKAKEREAKAAARAVARAEEKTELEVDEEDEKLLADIKKQGYCHFRREYSEEEKARDFTPRRIEGEEGSMTPGSGASAWNAAGTTMEERDYTEWATKCLKDMLPDAIFTDDEDNTVRVSSVDKCEGLVNVCVIKGQARPHVDVHITADWEVSIGDETYKGKLEIAEVSIEGIKDGSLQINRTFKKKSSAGVLAVTTLLASLEQVIRSQLHDFLGQLEAKC